MKQPVPTSYTYLRINWLSSTVERDVENQTYLSEVGEDFFFFFGHLCQDTLKSLLY